MSGAVPLDWQGPGGSEPPVTGLTVDMLWGELDRAIAGWRTAVAAVAGGPAPPDFANTVLALEAAFVPLDRARQLVQLHASLCATPELDAVQGNLLASARRAEDDAWLNPAIHARLHAVLEGAADLGPEARRVTELLAARTSRRGAGLPQAARVRLAEINAELAATGSEFQRNVAAEEARHTLVTDRSELDGLPDDAMAAAAKLAAERGSEGAWAIAHQRPVVMTLLAHARGRALRERVWRAWTARCDEPGPHDNRPVLARLLALRTEKARLLGYPDHAAYAFADRMVDGPGRAETLIKAAADRVRPATLERLDDLQALAAVDGIDQLQPWDRYFYDERLRQTRFNADGARLREYLEAGRVAGAALAAAARLHGIAFTPAPHLDVHHPDVRAYRVHRAGRLVGTLFLDLVARPGKRGGSWMQPIQHHSAVGPGTLPVALVVTSTPPASGNAPALMTWAHALVTFHELGHALHLLLSAAPYPSLGSLEVEWDLIELPALLNERWIEDRALLAQHLRHWRTGEPVPLDLLDGAFAAARADRVFSLTLDYLASALIDLRLHSGGSAPDIEAVERKVLAELRVPPAIDQIMRPAHLHHISTEAYAAGLYAYLWSDVLAADAAHLFLGAPGGLYDADIAARWREELLAAGALRPGAEAFRSLRGRDPAPDALFERFELPA